MLLIVCSKKQVTICAKKLRFLREFYAKQASFTGLNLQGFTCFAWGKLGLQWGLRAPSTAFLTCPKLTGCFHFAAIYPIFAAVLLFRCKGLSHQILWGLCTPAQIYRASLFSIIMVLYFFLQNIQVKNTNSTEFARHNI